MWIVMITEFDVTCATEIRNIMVRVISKSFMEFLTIKEYCQVYQKIYNEITRQLINKNGYQDQKKVYKLFLQSE